MLAVARPCTRTLDSLPFRIAIFTAAAVFLLSGCSDVRRTTCSGLINNPGELQPMTYKKRFLEDSNAVIYQKQYMNWNKYSRIVIEPVRIAPSARLSDMKPKELRDLSVYAQKSLIKSFSKDYQVLQVPTLYGTLTVQSAITDIDKSNPMLNLVTMAAVKLPFDTAGITMEIKVIDSRTREPYCEMIAYGNGNVSQVLESLSSIGQAKVVIDNWTRRLAASMQHKPVPSNAMASAKPWQSTQPRSTQNRF